MQEVDQALARAYTSRQEQGPRGRELQAPPAPHFPLDRPASSRPGVEPLDRLRWPETVRLLERAHADRFESLAEFLVATQRERQLRVVVFTSCQRAEGRTTLVLTLAKALGRRPGRTLIVDADLSGPMIAGQLGLSPRLGLDDVVLGSEPLNEALIEAPDEHLTILPLRAAVAQPREFLGSNAWPVLMARLRREFDLILLDGSPLFTGLSAALLHRSVDAAVLVHHRSLTSERSLLRAREVLAAGGVPLLGLAETFV